MRIDKSDHLSANDFVQKYRNIKYKNVGIEPKHLKKRQWFEEHTVDTSTKLYLANQLTELKQHYDDQGVLYPDNFFDLTTDNFQSGLNFLKKFPDEDVATQLMLVLIENAWEKILTDRKKASASYISFLDEVILTVAPTGRLDCICYVGNNNDYAIILDNEIGDFYRTILGYFSNLLSINDAYIWDYGAVREHFHNNYKMHPEIGTPNYPHFMHVLPSLIDSFCREGSLKKFDRDEFDIRAPSTQEHKKFINYALDGILQFTLCHEYAHIIWLDHHRGAPQIDEEHIEHIRIRKNEWALKYRHLYDWPEDKEVHDRLCLQGDEFYADKVGFNIWLHIIGNNALKENEPERLVYAYFGLQLSFYIEALVDRTLFLRSEGYDCHSSALYSRDRKLHNMLVRNTHPSYESRLENITYIGWKAFEDESELPIQLVKQLMSIDRILEMIFFNSWEYYFSDIAGSTENLKSKVSRRFRDRIKTIVGNSKRGYV